jgi:hypothetical protein
MEQNPVVTLRSPSGETKEVVVTDPRKDLVPLMAQGYHQVRVPETEKENK